MTTHSQMHVFSEFSVTTHCFNLLTATSWRHSPPRVSSLPVQRARGYFRCQTQLFELWLDEDACETDSSGRCALVAEFRGYALLYALCTRGVGSAETALALSDARLALLVDPAPDPTLERAIRIASSLNCENHAAFFALARDAQDHSRYILDLILPRVRARAYKTLLRAYAPTLGVRRVSLFLGFGSDHSACREYLTVNCGAVIDGNHLHIKPSRAAHDLCTPASVSNL